MIQVLFDHTFAELVQAWLAVLLASVVRSVTGFGFALVAIPVFSLFLSPAESVVLCAALTLVSNISSLPTYREYIPYTLLTPLIAWALLGTLIGTFFLVKLTPVQFQFLTGLSVVIACVVLLLAQPRAYRINRWITAVAGLISGTMNGILAIPGPPIILYVMATEQSAERARALLLSFFLSSALFALIGFGLAGLIVLKSLWLIILTMPAVMIGNRVGYRLFKKLDGNDYRSLALGCLFIMGGLLMFKNLSSIN
jgi:uncharacterized membrane protein YfcA